MPTSTPFQFSDLSSFSSTLSQWGSSFKEAVDAAIGWNGLIAIGAGGVGCYIILRAINYHRKQAELLSSVTSLHLNLSQFIKNFKLPDIYTTVFTDNAAKPNVSEALQKLLDELRSKIQDRDALLNKLEKMKSGGHSLTEGKVGENKTIGAVKGGKVVENVCVAELGILEDEIKRLSISIKNTEVINRFTVSIETAEQEIKWARSYTGSSLNQDEEENSESESSSQSSHTSQPQFSPQDYLEATTLVTARQKLTERIQAIEITKQQLIDYSKVINLDLKLLNENAHTQENVLISKLDQEISNLKQAAALLKGCYLLQQISPCLKEARKLKFQDATLVKELDKSQAKLRKFTDGAVQLTLKELDAVVDVVFSNLKHLKEELKELKREKSLDQEKQRLAAQQEERVRQKESKRAIEDLKLAATSTPQKSLSATAVQGISWESRLQQVRIAIQNAHTNLQLSVQGGVAQEEPADLKSLVAQKALLKMVVSKQSTLDQIRNKIQAVLEGIRKKYPEDYDFLLILSSQFKEESTRSASKQTKAEDFQSTLAEKLTLSEEDLLNSPSPSKLNFEEASSSDAQFPSFLAINNSTFNLLASNASIPVPPPPPPASTSPASTGNQKLLTPLTPQLIKTPEDRAALEKIEEKREEILSIIEREKKELLAGALKLLFIDTTLALLAEKLSTDLKTDLTLIEGYESLPERRISVSSNEGSQILDTLDETGSESEKNDFSPVSPRPRIRLLKGAEIPSYLGRATTSLLNITMNENVLAALQAEEEKIEVRSKERATRNRQALEQKQNALKSTVKTIVDQLKALFVPLEATALKAAHEAWKNYDKLTTGRTRYQTLIEKKVKLEKQLKEQKETLTFLQTKQLDSERAYSDIEKEYHMYELAQTVEVAQKDIKKLEEEQLTVRGLEAATREKLAPLEEKVKEELEKLGTIEADLLKHTLLSFKEPLDNLLSIPSDEPESAYSTLRDLFKNYTESVQKNTTANQLYPKVLTPGLAFTVEVELMLKRLQQKFKSHSQIHQAFPGKKLGNIDLSLAGEVHDHIMVPLKELKALCEHKTSALIFNNIKKSFDKIVEFLVEAQKAINEIIGDPALLKTVEELQKKKTALQISVDTLEAEKQSRREELSQQVLVRESLQREIDEALLQNQQIAHAKAELAEKGISPNHYSDKMEVLDLDKGSAKYKLDVIRASVKSAEEALTLTEKEVSTLNTEYTNLLASLEIPPNEALFAIQAQLDSKQLSLQKEAQKTLLGFATAHTQTKELKKAESCILTFDEKGISLSKDTFLIEEKIPVENYITLVSVISQFLANHGKKLRVYYQRAERPIPEQLPEAKPISSYADKELISQLGAIFAELLAQPGSIEIYLKAKAYYAACSHSQKIKSGQIKLDKEEALIKKGPIVSQFKKDSSTGESSSPGDFQALKTKLSQQLVVKKA